MHRLRALAASLVFVLPLAGCWGGDDDPTPTPELTAPTKTPAEGEGWNQRVRPERPKDVKSEEGLRAYVDYLVAVPTYAFAARDPSALADLGDAESCHLCGLAGDVGAFYAQEVQLYEERPTVRIMTLGNPSEDRFVVEAEIHSPPSQRFDPRSGELRGEEPAHTSGVWFEVEWVEGRWELTYHRAS